MDKPKKQVRKAPECEECKERNKTVDNVIRKIEETEPKKRSLFDLLQSLDAFNHSVITIKIEITWPKDMQDM